MTMQELYDEIIAKFKALPEVQNVLDEKVVVTVDDQPKLIKIPEGNPSLVSREETMVIADFRGTKGQAFTEHPQAFEGTVREAIELPFGGKYIEGATIAVINAVMAHFGLIEGTCHCDEAGHEECAKKLDAALREGRDLNSIILVGYQGYMVKQISETNLAKTVDFRKRFYAGETNEGPNLKQYMLWTLDRDPANITKEFYGNVPTNGGFENRRAAFAWGQTIVCTGSALCTGFITEFMNSGLEIMYYGVTIAGVAKLLGLKRWCPCSK